MDKIIVNKESFSKVFDKGVRDGKSCGPDNVSATDLLLHKESSIHVLFGVFKKSVETGSFPSDWKKAKVTCVYKKGSKKCCSNYRPISLLSIPSKVVERYICSILQTHLDSFNLLSEYQWGFRKHSSTEDLFLNMTERWRHAIDNGKSVVVLFIDFQKAFDSVSHPILLRKLGACGISGELLESYLSSRKIILSSSPNLNALNDINIRAARYIMKIKKSVPKDQVLQTCNWNSDGRIPGK